MFALGALSALGGCRLVWSASRKACWKRVDLPARPRSRRSLAQGSGLVRRTSVLGPARPACSALPCLPTSRRQLSGVASHDPSLFRQRGQRAVVRRQRLAKHHLLAVAQISRHRSLVFAPCCSNGPTRCRGPPSGYRGLLIVPCCGYTCARCSRHLPVPSDSPAFRLRAMVEHAKETFGEVHGLEHCPTTIETQAGLAIVSSLLAALLVRSSPGAEGRPGRRSRLAVPIAPTGRLGALPDVQRQPPNLPLVQTHLPSPPGLLSKSRLQPVLLPYL